MDDGIHFQFYPQKILNSYPNETDGAGCRPYTGDKSIYTPGDFVLRFAGCEPHCTRIFDKYSAMVLSPEDF